MDHRFYGLALAHADLNTDFFVYIAVIAFGISFDFIKSHRHRRYLLDCRRKQRIVFNAGRQFMRSQFRKRFTIGLRHTFHFRLTVFIQHSQTRILVDFLPLFPFLYRGRRDDLDALFPLFHIAVKLIFPGIVPSHQRSIWTLHCDQQRIIEAVIVEFRHCEQVLRIHFRSKNVLYTLFQPFRDFFHLLFAVNCHASPPFS